MAAALVLAALGGGPVAAKKKPPAPVKTTVTAQLTHTPGGNYSAIDGVLKSKNEGCILGRRIELFRKEGARDVLVKRVKMGDTYHFWPTIMIQPPPAAGTRFYVKAPKRKLSSTITCAEGRSALMTATAP
jgi:hypothetical protein